jgi:hypothetical protein
VGTRELEVGGGKDEEWQILEEERGLYSRRGSTDSLWVDPMGPSQAVASRPFTSQVGPGAEKSVYSQ